MDLASVLIGFFIAAVSAAVSWWLTNRTAANHFEPQLKLLAERCQEAQARLQDEAASAKQRLDDAARLFAKLDQEFVGFREGSAARETMQNRRIAELNDSLRTAESGAALLQDQLPALKSRLEDLQAALRAEQGKHSALEEALKARADLAAAMTAELAEVRKAREADLHQAAARETEMKATIAAHEAALADENNQALKQEVERLREVLAKEQVDAESRLADHKKKLAAADQRIQMLQKEIMNLVSSGSASDAAATVVAAEESEAMKKKLREAELRAQELELKLAQSDSETRKKLREAEYRVCELEFKLAEAEDKKSE